MVFFISIPLTLEVGILPADLREGVNVLDMKYYYLKTHRPSSENNSLRNDEGLSAENILEYRPI